MAVVDAPLHTVWLVTPFTVGAGLTVIVNVVGVPVHVTAPLVYEGVTVIVAVTGDAVALVAVNEPILPVPFAANPIDVVLFVHVYTVPITDPVKFTAAVDAPLHTVWLVTEFTVGAGFTVMVNVLEVPAQLTPALV
jgi:hypothetical protein